MIIPISGVNTLADYILRKETLDKFRPDICPGCKKERTFWRHGNYKRFVFDGFENVLVRINRFRCSNCALVVSCIFSFMTPYVRFASRVICMALENFSQLEMSYSEQAIELTNIDSESPPKPSSSQIFRWVDLMSRRSESLLFNLQKHFLMRGLAYRLFDFLGCEIANQHRARTEDKRTKLQKLGELLQMARLMWSEEPDALYQMHASFFCHVESLQALFCARPLKLPTTHNLQPSVF